jgi:hypothetical protein
MTIPNVANCIVEPEKVRDYGQKYIVDGALVAPTGQLPLIRTVWVVDTGTDRPRLVTAYPMNQESRS